MPGVDRPLEEALGLFRRRASRGGAGATAGSTSRCSRSIRSRVGDRDERAPRLRGTAGRRRRTTAASSRRAASTSRLRPSRRIVSWNGRGRPSGRSASASPSTTGLPHGQRPRPLHDLGHAGRHVLELPREDAHLVARAVDLEPRAVELVLERRLAEALERLFRVAGGARQHRRHRGQEAQREATEAGRTLLERRAGQLPDARRVHRGPPHVRRRRGPRRARSPRSRGPRALPAAPRPSAARRAGGGPARRWPRAARAATRSRRSAEPGPVSRGDGRSGPRPRARASAAPRPPALTASRARASASPRRSGPAGASRSGRERAARSSARGSVAGPRR